MKKECFKGYFCAKQGFTLIELLVVVLIIGILAAMAVPQYQKAVAKSWLATVKPIVASVSASAETYYLENGKYPTLLTELAVAVPTPVETSHPAGYDIYTYNWGTCTLQNNSYSQFFGCQNTKRNLSYTQVFEHADAQAGQRLCSALHKDEIAHVVCKAETGKPQINLPDINNRVFAY